VNGSIACRCGRPLHRGPKGYGAHADGSPFGDACRPTVAEFRAGLAEITRVLDQLSALAIPARIVGLTEDTIEPKES